MRVAASVRWPAYRLGLAGWAALSLLAMIGAGTAAPPARAASSLQAMFEDDDMLTADPAGTLEKFRMLGVQTIRLSIRWQDIAPNPRSRRVPAHFNGADPAAYPASRWATLDGMVRAAAGSGIALDFDLLGPAPRWAVGPGAPRGNTNFNWNPNPRLYEQFVQAVGRRYSGTYDPRRKRLAPGAAGDLPRVSFWSVWNEPDYGPSLAPQGVMGHLTIENSPRMYRNLVDAAWTALQRAGHGADTFIWGELAPRGKNYWGVFSGMKPLVFLRAMYCVDSRYRPLKGTAAAVRGCPATPAGSRRFRALNPALFSASGVSNHPYMRWYRPDREAVFDPDYSTLGEIGTFERALDRLQRVYGSSRRFAVWNTEFGYLTSPPKHDNQVEPGGQRYPWVKQTTAAYYLNWAEYLSWRDPRIRSFFQYLMKDPLPSTRATDWGGFASGLLNYDGSRKPGYFAWRMPVYLPVTSTRRGRALEVWGCARPAPFAALDTGAPQSVDIQFKQGRGGYSTLQSVALRGGCYFDVPVRFPISGTMRLSWSYPSGDSQLGYFDPLESHTAYSRPVTVSIR